MTIMLLAVALVLAMVVVAVIAFAVTSGGNSRSTHRHSTNPHSANPHSVNPHSVASPTPAPAARSGHGAVPLRTTAATVLLCVGLALFATLRGNVTVSRTVEEPNAPLLITGDVEAPRESTRSAESAISESGTTSLVTVEETADDSRYETGATEPETVVADTAKDDSHPQQPDSTEKDTTLSAGQLTAEAADTSEQPSADQQFFILPMSSESLEQAVGPEYAERLRELSESIPSNLPRAYALVPVPGPMPDGIPDGLEQVLTPDRITALANAFSTIWANHEDSDQPGSTATLVAEDYPQEEQPAWMDNPGLGRMVVKSSFVDASTTTEEALRPAVVVAFHEHINKMVARKFTGDTETLDSVRITLTNEAFKACLVSSYTRTEILTTRFGSTPMRQVFALVEIPAHMESQALDHIAESIQLNRTISTCIAAVAGWIAILLVTILLRIRQSHSALRRWVAVPVCGLLVLPCLLIACGTIATMVNDEVPAVFTSPDEIVVDEAVKVPVTDHSLVL